MPINKYLDAEISGLDSFVDYSGLSDDSARLTAFRNLIAQEHTQEHRGHLDQISPAAHRQLIREIDALTEVLDGTPPAGLVINDGDPVGILDLNSGAASGTVTDIDGTPYFEVTLSGTSCVLTSNMTLELEGGAGTVTFTVTDGVMSGTLEA